jgi:hypothetical protein
MSERIVSLTAVAERQTTRAQRFAIRVPLRYRVQATRTWRRGDTINISSSGVLFQGDYLAELNTPVELNLLLPVVNSEGAAEVICRGTIVRTLPSWNGDQRPALALKILHYHLIHPWNATDEHKARYSGSTSFQDESFEHAGAHISIRSALTKPAG